MAARKVITLHGPMGREFIDQLLGIASTRLENYGFRWWISTESLPNIVLMADTPAMWHHRGPSAKELAHFFELWESGQKEEAQKFVREGGFPLDER